MPDFQLTAIIDTTDLTTISEIGQKIVLVKSFAPQGPANVAWVAVTPFESNAIEWAAQPYGLYASQQQDSGGVIIRSEAFQDDAQSASQYTFLENGTFQGPTADPSLQQNQYKVLNQFGSTTTFGMTQPVQANGNAYSRALLNASTVPNQNLVIFEPEDQVTIFLSTDVTAGQIIEIPSIATAAAASSGGVITSQATTLDFSNSVMSITVKYDGQQGRFVEVS